MITLNKEQHEQFVRDPEYCNQILLDLSARIITEFWRQSISTLRKEVIETNEFMRIMEQCAAKHPGVPFDNEFFALLIEQKSEHPDWSSDELLDYVCAKRISDEENG